jgi:hypothetical protein
MRRITYDFDVRESDTLTFEKPKKWDKRCQELDLLQQTEEEDGEDEEEKSGSEGSEASEDQ